MLLRQLGIYGWETIERFLVGSIAGRFSTLMVGGAGTGKTELCERIFTALDRASQLKGEAARPWGYRNASTAQIEDMTGFPLLPPMDVAWQMHAEGKTPTMLWVDSPQAVRHYHFLVADEINRIPPMLQNKWFSLIAERRIDGMETSIESIIAAMNPVEEYEGTEPLDRAFADRFVWLIRPPAFKSMSTEDKVRIARTRMVYNEGDGMAYGLQIPDDACAALDTAVVEARRLMSDIEAKHGKAIATYAAGVVDMLGDASLESRRVAMIAQGIVALHAATVAINGSDNLSDTALESLRHSMVHTAMGEIPPQDQLLVAAHEANKTALIGVAATQRAKLSRVEEPNARVGMCIADQMDAEVLSTEIQNAHNHYMRTDPVHAAAFSMVTLSILKTHSERPYKFVLDEMAASVLNLFQDTVNLPGISLVSGMYPESEEMLSTVERISRYRKSSTGEAVLLLAGHIYANTSKAAIRTNTVLSQTGSNPAVSQYIHFNRAITSAEAVLRSHIHALHYEST